MAKMIPIIIEMFWSSMPPLQNMYACLLVISPDIESIMGILAYSYAECIFKGTEYNYWILGRMELSKL
jgi:hypothetical protein